jgi:ABC-type polysaccharide/polyol phosphate transport system ATPase subunit
MALIEVRDVAKAFQIPSVRRQTVREHVLGVLEPRQFRTLQVLNGISFDVAAGEAIGIMGRNGCGKSTLLKILCGIFPADRGTVRVSAAITPILELGVGWNAELDAVDNVCLIGSAMGLTLPEVRQKMDSILSFAELDAFANLKLKHYSSGMSSRLGYAVAFEAVREVLVLDEVFAVGDAGFKVKCETRFRQLHAAGHTVVLVSHTPGVIADFCDRAMLLESGRVQADGDASEVATRYVALVSERPSESPF